MSENYAEALLEVQERMEALLATASEVKTTEDATVFQSELAVLTAEMDGIAEAWENAELSRWGLTEAPIDGIVSVQLTPRQQEMVRAETGIELLVIDLPGAGSQWLKTMPHAVPTQLDGLILKEARRRMARKEALEEVEAKFQELETSDNPEVVAQIKTLREDPAFLAGLLHEEVE